MRIARHVISVLAILVLLTSCSSERNFSKRKYLPGFFHDREGKNEITAANKPERTNAFQADSSAAKANFKAEETKAVAVTHSQTDSIPEQQNKFASTEKRQAETEPLFMPAKEHSVTDEPAPDFDEQKRINLALIFALAAVALFLAIVITTAIGTVGIFTMPVLLVALGCAITGMVIARKIRFKHFKDEAYEGKTKVIIARIVGITAIVLTAAFLALLAFAIAVFAYGW